MSELEFSGDTLRLANADRRNSRRLTVLSASKARHTQRTRNNIAAHPDDGSATYVHAVAEYFQVPGDLADLQHWWTTYFMQHRAAPRVIFLVLAHIRSTSARRAFLRKLGHLKNVGVRQTSDKPYHLTTPLIEKALAAMALARREVAKPTQSSLTQKMDLLTMPEQSSTEFIERVCDDTTLSRRVDANLKKLHLATPSLLKETIFLLHRLLQGHGDAGDRTRTTEPLRLHIQLIRAVLYGSGNGWYFEADPMGLLGSPGPPYEMRVYSYRALLDAVDEPILAGVLASAAHSVESLVPGSTLEAKADWLRKHKIRLEGVAAEIDDQEAERRSIDKAAADAAVAAAREAIFERLDALPALLEYARDKAPAEEHDLTAKVESLEAENAGLKRRLARYEGNNVLDLTAEDSDNDGPPPRSTLRELHDKETTKRVEKVKKERDDHESRGELLDSMVTPLESQRRELQAMVSAAAEALMERDVPTRMLADDAAPFYYSQNSWEAEQEIPWNAEADRPLSLAEGIAWVHDNAKPPRKRRR